MQDLITELVRRFGVWVVLALILGVVLVWLVAHLKAEPGEKISIFWGMVEYMKGKPKPGQQPQPRTEPRREQSPEREEPIPPHTSKHQVQDEFANIGKNDLIIGIECVMFIHKPKPLLWQNIEEKSRTVMKALYGRILHLGYTPDTFIGYDEDFTIVYYRAIPPQYFQELKKAVDAILCEHLVTVTWRENKRMDFNLWVKLGKDTGR